MRLPRWKKDQRKRKEKKRFTFARNIFLIICLSLFLGVGFKAWGSFKESIWDGKSRLTLTLDSNPILVASFDPGDKTLNFLSIPPHTYLEVIHGYGFYKAESIWKLGELEKGGGELLAGSLQEYLGVPVDGWVTTRLLKTQASTEGTEMKSFFLNNLVELIKNGDGANLTRWDLVRLWWGVRGVRFDKTKLVDLGKTNAVAEVTLPDGTIALEPDPLRLDQLVTRLFSDKKIKKEALSIGVYNATEYPGLAKKAARIIDNIGGQVIEVGDWKMRSEKCEVRGEKKLANTYTARKLLKIFDCQYGNGEMGESRAEIAIILGQDYWRKLQEK